MAKLHFWPKRGQWDPMWSEFDSIWIKFDPNWVKLGPNEAQSIFTNSRSTAQADVMLSITLWKEPELEVGALSLQMCTNWPTTYTVQGQASTTSPS